MRVFLLPLTTRQALIYCQKAALDPTKKPSIIERVQNKAAEQWAKWEKAEKGWQKQLVTYGNRGLQRIPYQEWGLKSFPSTSAALQAETLVAQKQFDVVYPSNIMAEEDVDKVLRRLARERKQLHFNRFIGSMVAMPFTIPFALIPVIPNIPFFYVAYRCWSHWRALRGSDHLDFLLDNRLLRNTSAASVRGIYDKYAPGKQDSFEFVTASQIEAGTDPTEQKLLPAGSHVYVAEKLRVPELSGEVERAVWQVDQSFVKRAQAAEKAKQLAAPQQASVQQQKEKPPQ